MLEFATWPVRHFLAWARSPSPAEVAAIVAALSERKPEGPYVEISRLYRQILNAAKQMRRDPGAPTPHPDSWIEFDRLGLEAGYRKTFPFTGDYINDEHRFYSECRTGLLGIPHAIDIGIEGYLNRSDALKLYEMAYFCPGDILELGTYKGLSGSIMLQAMQSANRRGKIHTVDADRPTVAMAKTNIRRLAGARRVKFNVKYAGQFMQQAVSRGHKFGFIFVDHWHGYGATYEAATLGKRLIEDGGFVMFHDFNDPSNCDSQHLYGVCQAVAEVILPSEEFTFYGNFGACGLFRKETRGPTHAGPCAPTRPITGQPIRSKIASLISPATVPGQPTYPKPERPYVAIRELDRQMRDLGIAKES